MFDINFVLSPLVKSFPLHELYGLLKTHNNSKVQMFLSPENNPEPLFDDMVSFEGLFFYKGGSQFFISGHLSDEEKDSWCKDLELHIDRILSIMPYVNH